MFPARDLGATRPPAIPLQLDSAFALGLLLLAVGLLLFAYGAGSLVKALSVNAYGFRGVVPAFLGLALLVYYVLRKRGG